MYYFAMGSFYFNERELELWRVTNYDKYNQRSKLIHKCLLRWLALAGNKKILLQSRMNSIKKIFQAVIHNNTFAVQACVLFYLSVRCYFVNTCLHRSPHPGRAHVDVLTVELYILVWKHIASFLCINGESSAHAVARFYYEKRFFYDTI